MRKIQRNQMINIQDFALNASISICPNHIVEPLHLKRWWRHRGVGELEKYFYTGNKISYYQEIDCKAISDHKKSLWYDSLNFQIQTGNEYSKRTS